MNGNPLCFFLPFFFSSFCCFLCNWTHFRFLFTACFVSAASQNISHVSAVRPVQQTSIKRVSIISKYFHLHKSCCFYCALEEISNWKVYSFEERLLSLKINSSFPVSILLPPDLYFCSERIVSSYFIPLLFLMF